MRLAAVLLPALPALLACGGLLVARRSLVVITVIGTSMVPTYQPGDRVLVRRTSRIRRGQVVVARPPGFVGFVIKRIAAIAGNEVVLIGDGPHSTDSREWGPVAVENVIGVVVARLRAATS